MKKILFLITLLFTTYTTYGYDYVNVVNGNGLSACNKQLYDRMGNQKYSCTYGGGCALNGQLPSYYNSSANPSSYGACVLLSDRNTYSTNNTNYNYLSNREIRIVNLYDELLGYEPDSFTLRDWSNSNYSISEIRELIKKTDEYKRKNPTYNNYVNIVNANGYAECNNQILNKMGNQRYSCTYGGGCGVNGLPASYNNPSANPYRYGACILETERNTYIPTTQTTYNNYVNIVNANGYAECNNQILNKMGNQRYSCTYGGGCGVNGLPASYNNPSANPYRYGACILETERNTYIPTTQTTYNNYVNIVNANGYAECNNQILNKMGNQRYSCTYGGGCGVNGLPASYNNPSANPYRYGACILETERNRYYNPNTSTNNSPSTTINMTRENQVNEAYREIFGYYPDYNTLKYWTGTNYSVSMIKELLKQTPEYKSKNNYNTPTYSNNNMTDKERKINDIYLELFGRNADEQGLKYRASTNYSYSMMKELMKKSDEYSRR